MGARAMVEGVPRLGAAMADELDGPLRIGIGIHTGPAVVGRMGYGMTMYLTAVGDTVHVASRFQDLTKQYDAQLVISEQVAERAGLDVSAFPRHEITVRNRREPLAIRVSPTRARSVPPGANSLSRKTARSTAVRAPASPAQPIPGGKASEGGRSRPSELR